MNNPSGTLLADQLVGEEDKLLACIHCGLCLEACPTYVITGDENDGPRGRLYLMRAVGEGRLTSDSPAFERHIDRCLGCRACEQVCPAGVEYGQLLEEAPYTERDIHPPVELKTFDEGGDHYVVVKARGRYTKYHYKFHPFDVVGWDGYVFPWSFKS